ncbi:hypothetical protein HOI83_00380 [Candidatus Uhrbacteria bacterium]|jgi:hypothetical protein|nr:hypothetical protein [Candidatus Uhrbacteria bacterium]
MTLAQQLRAGLAVIALVMMGGTALIASPASAVGFEAGSPSGALSQAASQTTLGASSEDQIFITIGQLVNIALGLLGIIFFVLLVYAGFLWMTAAGDPDKVTKAKTMITQAVIGIVIILSAFAISTFVINQLIDATSTVAS